MKTFKLSTKLSLFIVTGIIILVGIIGLFVDSILKSSYYEESNKRMLHGFVRLSTDLNRDINNLHKSLSLIESDTAFIASIELINNYQDKKNYNAILLDEEKKIIANELLSRVKLSNNDQIYLYDASQNLIAFVERPDNKYIQHFISYENGNQIIFSKLESDEFYIKNTNKNVAYLYSEHTYLYPKDVEDKGIITFHHDNDQISVRAHLSLASEKSNSYKAHIEMDKKYDENYFASLSANLDMHLSGTNHSSYSDNAFLLTDVNQINEINMVQTDKLSIGIANIKTEEGLYFYQVKLDNTQLQETLTKVRQEFLLITISAVILVLIMLHYFFKRSLYTPLNNLMEQINKLENSSQNDNELKAISDNVNQLLSAAFCDELTGAYNRAYFKENIDKILIENNGQTGIIFFDIDHFKKINDTYGHGIGDLALIELSKLVNSHIRKDDKLVRWGGEEFVLIVKVESDQGLIAIAEHLRQEIAAYRFPEVGNFTCSFGCQLHSENSDIKTTLHRADKRLYQAKADGRNRVVG